MSMIGMMREKTNMAECRNDEGGLDWTRSGPGEACSAGCRKQDLRLVFSGRDKTTEHFLPAATLSS